jgi:phage terminase large subunit
MNAFAGLALLLMSVVIVQASPGSSAGFECYGANREFWRYRGPEAILSGPYETGKTLTALFKLHLLLAKYPGAQALMVRKTYKSLIGGAVVTYERKVLPRPPGDARCPIHKFGGERPEWYDYPNGSRLWLGGMDNPDRFLSSEFDFIYVNQAEELTVDDGEKLTGRATGRAGNAPYAQVMGDCNPSYPQHWIRNRARLRLFYSRHEDNPTLFDPVTGQITERGKLTMAALDALTGVRYKRGRLGLWVAAEGQVYEEYDDAVHLVNRFEIPLDWRRFRSVDFGYTNPFSCSWYAMDPDGRLYRYRQIYFTGRLVEDHARQINELSKGERIEATVADHDAEDRATLERYGIPTKAAVKDISPGLQAVAARLRRAGDGKPRLFLMRDSLVETDPSLRARFKPTSTEDEFPLYVWPEARDGKAIKELPVDENNHGLDELRYLVMHVDGPNVPVPSKLAAVAKRQTQTPPTGYTGMSGLIAPGKRSRR